jgi:hypothetical protein
MPPRLTRFGFVTNDALIVIAVGAVWIGLSLPLYVRLARHFAGGGPVGPLHQAAALLLAAATPPLAVGALRLLEWLIEQLRSRLRRR